MSDGPQSWTSTTHDWVRLVDRDHLRLIREQGHRFAAGGVRHLLLEVLAHADEEAKALGRIGRAFVTRHADGSVSVRDDGRGTDTRRDAEGMVLRKPVMATKDLRFFDAEDPPVLPDGYPRRGISVVAALSTWLEHTNYRLDGSWTQRYEHGVPVTDLVQIPSSDSTGTRVRFLPDPAVVIGHELQSDQLWGWRWIVVELRNDL